MHIFVLAFQRSPACNCSFNDFDVQNREMFKLKKKGETRLRAQSSREKNEGC